MPSLSAVVLGASGLIGQHVVRLLLADEAFTDVRVLVRKQMNISHNKLEQRITNFGNMEDFKSNLGTADVVFVCVGTTQAKVHGDKEAYRKVDYDIPINAARFAHEAGFKTYLLVSAVGANKNSSNFYVKLKGEVEKDVALVPLPAIHIFKPSMLLGYRQERRIGESIGKVFMQLFSFAFIGAAKKYKGIDAEVVAKAMVAAAKSPEAGLHKYEYDAMKMLADNYA